MKQKEFIFLLLSIFIIVIAFIAFNIYHTSTTSTIPETLRIQIIPIAPKFNTAIIDELKLRQKITPLYSIENSSSQTSSPAALLENPQSTQASSEGVLR